MGKVKIGSNRLYVHVSVQIDNNVLIAKAVNSLQTLASISPLYGFTFT